MSWHFLLGREEASWAERSLDGAPSALLSLLPIPEASCLPANETESLSLSLSGTMCEPLTASPSGGGLMSSAGDSLVRTSVLPVTAMGLTEREAGFGKKWGESLAKFDPVSSLWKTRQCLLFEDSTECLETLPRWGMMRDGELSAQTPPDSLTDANEFGCFVPTPTKSMWRGAAKKRYFGSPDYRASFTVEWVRTSLDCAAYLHPDSAELLMGWPIKWTELVPLETAKYQQWLHSHGGF